MKLQEEFWSKRIQLLKLELNQMLNRMHYTSISNLGWLKIQNIKDNLTKLMGTMIFVFWVFSFLFCFIEPTLPQKDIGYVQQKCLRSQENVVVWYQGLSGDGWSWEGCLADGDRDEQILPRNGVFMTRNNTVMSLCYMWTYKLSLAEYPTLHNLWLFPRENFSAKHVSMTFLWRGAPPDWETAVHNLEKECLLNCCWTHLFFWNILTRGS